MQREVKNPAYPLALNLILDHAEHPDYLRGISSDDLTFDRKMPFPTVGGRVSYLGRQWECSEVRTQRPPGGGAPAEWVVLTEQT